ncbi:hypothetical protein Hte_008059 [Hypoxylon texense]
MSLVRSSTRSTLLSLPIELRMEIFDYLLHCNRINCITDDVPYRVEWSGHEHRILPLLLVCRQFHQEIAPRVYRALIFGQNDFDPTLWRDFFRMIGPTNASYIKYFAIHYHCEGYAAHSGYSFYPCFEFPWNSADLWRVVFEAMWEAGARPKRVYVDVGDCWLFPISSDRCNPLKDLYFLKCLSWLFDRIEQIALSGNVDPLWGYALKARFGLQATCQTGHFVREL